MVADKGTSPAVGGFRERLIAVLPVPACSTSVADWPADEQDLYRNGFEDGRWSDFTTRNEALVRLRRGKVADELLDLMTGAELLGVVAGVLDEHPLVRVGMEPSGVMNEPSPWVAWCTPECGWTADRHYRSRAVEAHRVHQADEVRKWLGGGA